jgi:hypothetical protein
VVVGGGAAADAAAAVTMVAVATNRSGRWYHTVPTIEAARPPRRSVFSPGWTRNNTSYDYEPPQTLAHAFFLGQTAHRSTTLRMDLGSKDDLARQ